MPANDHISILRKLKVVRLKGLRLLNATNFLDDLPAFLYAYNDLCEHLERTMFNDLYILDKLRLFPYIEQYDRSEFGLQINEDGSLSYRYFPALIYYKYKEHRYTANCKLRIRQIRRVCKLISERVSSDAQPK